MAVPASKDELLAAIEVTFAQLSYDLDRVPTGYAREPVLNGHAKDTMMSPADLVAYLIGWNQQVLTWHSRRDASLPDEFPAPGIGWNELGRVAQRYYAEHHDDGWVTLREQFVEVKGQIVSLIQAHSTEELYGEPWYGKWTMGRMISFNTSSPYTNARRRIHAWLRTIEPAATAPKHSNASANPRTLHS